MAVNRLGTHSAFCSGWTARLLGVTDLVEVLVGFDGIAIANSKAAPRYNLALKDIYMALAKDIPGPDGKLAITFPIGDKK